MDPPDVATEFFFRPVIDQMRAYIRPCWRECRHAGPDGIRALPVLVSFAASKRRVVSSELLGAGLTCLAIK